VSSHATSTHARRGSKAPVNHARPNLRLALLHGSYFVVFLLLALRLFFMQVQDHAHASRQAASLSLHNVQTTAVRGNVWDRYGRLVALSEPAVLVQSDNYMVKNPQAEAKAMSKLIKIPVAALTKKLSIHNGGVILTNHVDVASGAAIASAFGKLGIVTFPSSSRSYPNGTLAESLLGRLNASGQGTTGLEYQFQSLLAGHNGLDREWTSGTNIPLPNNNLQVLKKAAPGTGLELTIDNNLQFVTERVLATQLAAVHGVTGQAVLMDVKTGEILADASLVNTKSNPGILGPIPSWGTSVGVPGIEQTINNLPFTQAYEPGSVFKAVTFSAALEAGTIAPKKVFTIPYSTTVGGRVFHDAELHGLEHLTATEILAQSSNIGTYEVGATIGENRILAQVERLGFGQLTSVNYPGETAGLLVNAANWYASDQVALPIGQVDAVPAIQVLDAYNAIANGGIFVEPKLIRATVGANGHATATPPSVQRRALSVGVARTMNQMLQQVVLAGTGTNAIIPGYVVAGKTGTATIPQPGAAKLLVGSYNASFVGFAPANNPTFSMIVVVERPTTTIFGGAVAAPVFQQVMSYALHHYNIASTGAVIKPLPGAGAFRSDVT